MAESKTGQWAFIIGVLLAIVAGLIPALQIPTVSWILVLLGLIVGFLNITAKEVNNFLIATIALLLVSGSLSSLPVLGTVISSIFRNIVVFVAPAALVVSLKAVYSTAQD
ncbi:MAG: hypothetical protein QXU88_00435 [Candidatus Woesearchaeota archaeon]